MSVCIWPDRQWEKLLVSCTKMCICRTRCMFTVINWVASDEQVSFLTHCRLNELAHTIQSTLVISNFTGPDKNVRVISSSRQPNCHVIGMTTVRLNMLGRHMYKAI